MHKRRNCINYSKFSRVDMPKTDKIYVDTEGNEYNITKQGELIFKNRVVSDYCLKSKYSKINLDLYCLKDCTHYIYKGMEHTLRQIQSEYVISVTLYHDYVQGFPFSIYSLRLNDRTDKIKTICDARKDQFRVTHFYWNGLDITNYSGTFKTFLIEKGMYSPSYENYCLEVDCRIELNESTMIDKYYDSYRYYFTSYHISNHNLFRRLNFTLAENQMNFQTFLGFGLFDRFKGVCSMSYEDKVLKIKNILKAKGVEKTEIERLSFNKVRISEKDDWKFIIRIGISKTNNKIQDNNSIEDSTSDNNSMTTVGEY